MKQVLRMWFPIAVGLTVACGLVYCTVQQVLRQDANDPQIQFAEDLVRPLNAGRTPQSLMGTNRTDLSVTLAAFAAITDAEGVPVAYSTTLGGQPPKIPAGVFEYVKAHGQDRFTWEPEEGLRIATVVDRYENASSSGFVITGRSLREVEKREHALMLQVLTGWLAGLVLTFGAVFLATYRKKEPVS